MSIIVLYKDFKPGYFEQFDKETNNEEISLIKESEKTDSNDTNKTVVDYHKIYNDICGQISKLSHITEFINFKLDSFLFLCKDRSDVIPYLNYIFVNITNYIAMRKCLQFVLNINNIENIISMIIII